MIISAGVNIYPAEIEDALHRHPDIDDVAVFGVPDDDWGERVHAAVQPRAGARLTADAVTAFARAHMADYQVPREGALHGGLPLDHPEGHVRDGHLDLGDRLPRRLVADGVHHPGGVEHEEARLVDLDP